MTIFLYYLIMAMFLPVRFASYNHEPACAAWIDQRFTVYAINFAASGYIHWIDSRGNKARLDAPCFYWTIPGVHYRYGCSDKVPWDQRWIAFHGPAADDFLTRGLMPRETDASYVQTYEPHRVLQDFDALLRYLPYMRFGENRAVVMLEALLLHIHEQKRLPRQPRTHGEALQGLVEAIEVDPVRTWDFRDECRGMFLSYSHFRRLFREMFGVAPHKYVLQARLKRASAGLRAGTSSVKQCAIDAGFEDIFYFTRQFKNLFGEPPATYARRFRYEHV